MAPIRQSSFNSLCGWDQKLYLSDTIKGKDPLREELRFVIPYEAAGHNKRF